MVQLQVLKQNYQVAIKVYRDSGGADGTETINGTIMGKVSCNSNCNTDYSDIRFTLENGNNSTLLDSRIKQHLCDYLGSNKHNPQLVQAQKQFTSIMAI